MKTEILIDDHIVIDCITLDAMKKQLIASTLGAKIRIAFAPFAEVYVAQDLTHSKVPLKIWHEEKMQWM